MTNLWATSTSFRVLPYLQKQSWLKKLDALHHQPGNLPLPACSLNCKAQPRWTKQGLHCTSKELCLLFCYSFLPSTFWHKLTSMKTSIPHFYGYSYAQNRSLVSSTKTKGCTSTENKLWAKSNCNTGIALTNQGTVPQHPSRATLTAATSSDDSPIKWGKSGLKPVYGHQSETAGDGARDRTRYKTTAYAWSL